MFYQLLISHFIFDYGKALTPSMIRDKSIGKPGWPIALHAFLHSLGVSIVLLLNSVSLNLVIPLALFEFITHFGIDVFKGKIETTFPVLKDPKQAYHWHLFQIDQFLHITIKFIISMIALG